MGNNDTPAAGRKDDPERIYSDPAESAYEGCSPFIRASTQPPTPKRIGGLNLAPGGFPWNPLAGQRAEDACRQYKQDRDPREPIFEFKRRTLVHFAADTESVLMTTRLAGAATHFLPFDKGCDGGAGNPPDPEGRTHRTAWLWESASTSPRAQLAEALESAVPIVVTTLSSISRPGGARAHRTTKP